MPANATPSQPELIIRKMTAADAADAAALSAELGYPVAADAMENRLKQFAEMENHAVFAACRQNHVVAWIDVSKPGDAPTASASGW